MNIGTRSFGRMVYADVLADAVMHAYIPFSYIYGTGRRTIEQE